ncbi:MAG TPA: hypothetical protein VM364_00840 [Vicinamibacterales bacterium]|nr:hypothetical protein [Vicinamibacterales bacterium]
MSKTKLEVTIRSSLSGPEYAQLVKDLRAAQRAFDRLEIVAPELLRSLVRAANRRRGAVAAAHEAFDDLIQELTNQRTHRGSPAASEVQTSLRLVKGISDARGTSSSHA